MKQKFEIRGMTCAACVSNVEKSARKVKGVRDVSVSLLINSMQVEYDEASVGEEQIIQAVMRAGYGASLPERAKRETRGATPSNAAVQHAYSEMAAMKFRLLASIAFMLPLMYIAMGHMLHLPMPAFLHGSANALNFAFTQFLLTLPVVYINRHYFQVGFKMLWRRHPNMDTLIAIGSGAAVIYGVFTIYRIGSGLGHGAVEEAAMYSMDLYFESCAMILTLISLGKYLEARSKGKTSEALSKLLDLAPKTATVLRDGIESEIPVSELVVGDIVVIRPGQSIPADGVILSGNAVLDQSALTGESMPVDKTVGEEVSAATVNMTGYFSFEARRVGEDTALQQIIRLVEDASATKAPIAKLADTISGVFVPIVIGIATVSTVCWLAAGQSFSFALSIGIAVLVISCPCALGLATPVAIMVGTGKGAQLGILFKSAEALERLSSIDTAVLDKTGTVTEGKPRLTDILCAEGVREDELLSIAAALEEPSEHPLAKAILQEAQKRGIRSAAAQDFSAETGRGVHANIGGKAYHAGNLAMMEALGIDVSYAEDAARAFAAEGKTPLYFAGESFMGLIGVADMPKATSKAAIDRFHAMGIDVILLTGDNAATAEAIGRKLGISKVIAGVLPQDKEYEVRRLMDEGKRVAMIGDGVNDAPALVRADVGIAIGAGTDIAMESADVVLVKSDLNDAIHALELSRATMRNIRQNLFWAFFYNSIGIPLAAGLFYTVLGWKLDPMIGAAAMSFSSVSVVTNALRLRWFRPSAPQVSVSEAACDSVPGDISTACPIPAPSAVSIPPAGATQPLNSRLLHIEGMMCEHCQRHVEEALNEIDGVSARVDLAQNTAYVAADKHVEDQALIDAVTEAGYEVISIEVLKGVSL